MEEAAAMVKRGVVRFTANIDLGHCQEPEITNRRIPEYYKAGIRKPEQSK